MVNLKAWLRLGGSRSQEQPQHVLRESGGRKLPPLVPPHRGGGLLEKPTAAGEPRPGDPQQWDTPKWQPPTKGTTPADRKRIRRRQARTPLK